MKNKRGFTLIEILIVMVVIGILAAIAIPSYNNQLVRGTRAGVQTVMADIANKELYFLQSQRAYTQDYTVALAVSVPTDVANFYSIAVNVDNTKAPPQFTITATPKVGTRQANDGPLTLDQDGTKLPANKW